METTRLSFLAIVAKTIVVHTVTYFIVGVLAFSLLDYTTRFRDSIGELPNEAV